MGGGGGSGAAAPLPNTAIWHTLPDKLCMHPRERSFLWQRLTAAIKTDRVGSAYGRITRAPSGVCSRIHLSNHSRSSTWISNAARSLRRLRM